jgi:hypothetical protein
MIFFDGLRPPAPLDPTANSYKDWLHLNVMHHPSGCVGLINVSLHGAPDDPRSRGIGTALVHSPGIGWFGNVEIKSFGEAALGPASISLERVALAVHYPSGVLAASVRDPRHSLAAKLAATPAAAPVVIEEQLPLGSGWISWHAVPRLTLEGEWLVGKERMGLSEASAYHDHNWGRWRWGDDMGWEWGCFLAPAPGAAFVLSLVTDRAHRQLGTPSLAVQAGGARRTFAGGSVRLEYGGALEVAMRRVPGALAALHQDRAQLRLPKTLRVEASDGIDRVAFEFNARAAAQLIAADPSARGYSFIHEMPGEFTYTGLIAGLEIEGSGLGVLEHVY